MLTVPVQDPIVIFELEIGAAVISYWFNSLLMELFEYSNWPLGENSIPYSPAPGEFAESNFSHREGIIIPVAGSNPNSCNSDFVVNPPGYPIFGSTNAS